MRRRTPWRVLAMLALAGCATAPATEPGAAYFPLLPGTHWEYEVDDGEDRSMLVVEAVGERELPGWPTPVFLMLETRADDGPYEHSSPVGYVVDGRYVARLTAMGFDRDGRLRLLGQEHPTWMLPIDPRGKERWSQATRIFTDLRHGVGRQQWEVGSQPGDPIDVPAGHFEDVLEVRTTLRGPKGDVRAHFLDHYARGVGLVASSTRGPSPGEGPVLHQRLIRHSVPPP